MPTYKKYILLFAAIFGIIFLPFKLRQEYRFYSDEAEFTDCLVTDKGVRKITVSCVRRDYYWIKCSLSASRKEFEVENRMKRDFWEKIEKGEMVKVRYLPERPQDAYAQGSIGIDQGNIILDWVLLGLCAGGLIFYWVKWARK